MDSYDNGGGGTDNALLNHLVTEFVGPLMASCVNELLITRWYQTKLDNTYRIFKGPLDPIPLTFLFATRLHERIPTAPQFTLVVLRDTVRPVLPGRDIGIVCNTFELSIIACRRCRIGCTTADNLKWVWMRGSISSRCNKNWSDFLEYIHSFTCQYPRFERLDYNVVDNDSTK